MISGKNTSFSTVLHEKCSWKKFLFHLQNNTFKVEINNVQWLKDKILLGEHSDDAKWLRHISHNHSIPCSVIATEIWWMSCLSLPLFPVCLFTVKLMKISLLKTAACISGWKPSTNLNAATTRYLSWGLQLSFFLNRQSQLSLMLPPTHKTQSESILILDTW